MRLAPARTMDLSLNPNFFTLPVIVRGVPVEAPFPDVAAHVVHIPVRWAGAYHTTACRTQLLNGCLQNLVKNQLTRGIIAAGVGAGPWK